MFEKSSIPGGRIRTLNEDGFSFDLGAQYLTVKDEQFRRYSESWREDGIVASWKGRMCILSEGTFERQQRSIERFVGVPGMRVITDHLADAVDTTCSCTVVRIAADGGVDGGL